MSDFTYEKGITGTTLETYEWDNTWWEHAEDPSLPRALIVGDSISCGYRRIVDELLAGKAYADGFGSSKALDNPYFVESVSLFIRQMHSCKAVFFNNGLHGWHLSPTEYETHYRRVLWKLAERFPGKSWVLMLSTPVRVGKGNSALAERNGEVLKRNAVVEKIAADLSFQVLDLYTPLASRPELTSNDGVHLIEEGYRLLAGIVAGKAVEILGR